MKHLTYTLADYNSDRKQIEGVILNYKDVKEDCETGKFPMQYYYDCVYNDAQGALVRILSSGDKEFIEEDVKTLCKKYVDGFKEGE